MEMPTRESDIVEFKTISDSNLPKDLWEAISAFSNADGGQSISASLRQEKPPVSRKT